MVSKLIRQHLNQTGDTIVEVLIAVAIISSVLAGAFLVSQKSTLAVRDGQEHSEMLQVLQGQVELLRSMALAQTDATGGVFDPSLDFFCIDSTTPNDLKIIKEPDLGTTSLAPIDNDSFDGYVGVCHNVQSRYNLSIVYDAANTKVFTFTGRWDGVGGNKSEEKLAYRITAGSVALVNPLAVPSGSLDAVASTVPAGNAGVPCYVTEGWTSLNCWNPGLINTSTQIAGLTKCVWHWGDGTSATFSPSNPECTPGQTFHHQYTPVGNGIPPTQIIYSATVTNYANTTFVDSAPVQVYVPY